MIHVQGVDRGTVAEQQFGDRHGRGDVQRGLAIAASHMDRVGVGGQHRREFVDPP